MALNGRYKYLYGLQTDALADDVTVVTGTTTPSEKSEDTSTVPASSIVAEKTEGLQVECISISGDEESGWHLATNTSQDDLGFGVKHDLIEAIPAA